MIFPSPLSYILSNNLYAKILKAKDPIRLNNKNINNGANANEPWIYAWIVAEAPINITWYPDVADATFWFTFKLSIVNIRIWPHPAAISPVLNPARTPPQDKSKYLNLSERFI